MSIELQNPIFVALDLDSPDAAIKMARSLRGRVGGFKVGPRLAIPFGSYLIEELAKLGPVFLDCKFLDIPTTMEAAVRAAFTAGASLATVHAWAGSEALAKLAKLEKELQRGRPFLTLAVTILTSFDEQTLPGPLKQIPILEQVEQLSQLAEDAGLNGIVASGRELPRLQLRFPKLMKVVPGIRLETSSDDQRRTMTPAEAIAAGASALVIGRPIIEAKDPVAATERILESL